MFAHGSGEVGYMAGPLSTIWVSFILFFGKTKYFFTYDPMLFPSVDLFFFSSHHFT